MIDLLLFLDTETTGLDASKHQLVEIAAALVRADGAVIRRACSKLRLEAGACVDKRALAANGYDPRAAEWHANAAPAADVLLRFAAWLPAEPFATVAHNASFDLRFLWSAYARCGIAPPEAMRRDVVCTVTMAQRLKARGRLDGSTSLDALCTRFGVTAERRAHTAAGDVTRLMGVYPRLLALDTEAAAARVR